MTGIQLSNPKIIIRNIALEKAIEEWDKMIIRNIALEKAIEECDKMIIRNIALEKALKRSRMRSSIAFSRQLDLGGGNSGVNGGGGGNSGGNSGGAASKKRKKTKLKLRSKRIRDSEECQFPFEFEKKLYDECISRPPFKGSYCKLKDNKIYKWGKCSN